MFKKNISKKSCEESRITKTNNAKLVKLSNIFRDDHEQTFPSLLSIAPLDKNHCHFDLKYFVKKFKQYMSYTLIVVRSGVKETNETFNSSQIPERLIDN